MNINRDYLIINDVKKSNIKLDNGSMFFYITDKNTQNIFVNLVINVSNNELIQKYANIENAEDYTLTMNIVKPSNTYKVIEGKLHDKEKAIFEFDLNEDCCDEIGPYRCELLTKCNINGREEVTTSNKLTYKVKSSVLNDLDDIVEAPEYPLVVQLFDKLSDIDQYEEDRRANELARQLAEEQRQTRFNALDADMTNSIQAINNKVVDVENRVSAKEQAVDKLVADTKADIDGYKEAKDQEIDEYKALKDTEINNAITAQDNKIDEAIANQNDRITVVENNDVAQDNRLDVLENRDTIHESRMTAIETKNVEQDNRLDDIEAIDVAQNTRLDAIEVKNQQQDDRLLDIEKVNKRQDMNLKCLFAESKNNMIDVTEEGNSIYLQNSTTGYTLIDEIKGNTLVNCNKEPDKELILNGNINTSGDNNITITEGVDGGLVDVALEGNTLVNVSKTKDSTAITMACTVENSGNHIALQGDTDGICRPVITGNTLWIDNDTEEVLTAFDEIKNLRLQSTFEDNLVTQEMIDSGEEEVDNLGKYKVDYKSTREDGTVDDTKTLYLNSPLLEGDTIEEKDNGIYHVHRYWQYTFTGSEDWKYESSYTNDTVYGCFFLNNGNITPKMATQQGAISDILPTITITSAKDFYLEGVACNGATISLRINKSKLSSIDLNGFKTWLQSNPVTSVYQLATPQYELIEQSNLTIPSYANGHLDFNTAVPVEKVDFLPFSEELTYLYPSTSYTVQFISDKAITADITLGGAQLLSQSIVAGLNRISITTPATLVDNKLIIDGVGAKISEVVVTDTDREFMYFEGMKSVGECEELEVISRNKNLANPKGVYDSKVNNDHFWTLVSSSNGEFVCQGSTENTSNVNAFALGLNLYNLKPNTTYCVGYKVNGVTANIGHVYKGTNSLWKFDSVIPVSSNKFTTPGDVTEVCLGLYYTKPAGQTITISDICVEEGNSITGYTPHQSNAQQLTHEPLRAVGDVKDKYVLIDGKWYIEKRCGIRTYQEGDKDNYKTDLVNTVYPLEMPTYEEIDYNPLEVYSGTTRITTNSVIPTNITVKNHGFNCLLKPSTTYTISSNLGLNTVITPSTLTEDCLRFMDTDTSNVTTMKDVLVLEGDWTSKADLIPANFSGIESAFEQEYDTEKGKYRVNVKIANEDKSKENNITFYINEPLRGIGDTKDKIYVKDDKVVVQRNCGIRAYEDGDFGAYPTDKVNTVYQLAEPTYEEVEYNDTKLFIESFKNSTLSYNSNVPVISKLYYSYSVPIVDTVAQTASISDQQDSMIIDLATQVAVMEMMLM